MDRRIDVYATFPQMLSLIRHSPDSGSLRGQDLPFGRLGQRQIAFRVGQEAVETAS